MVRTACVLALALLPQAQPGPGEPFQFRFQVHNRVLLSGIPFRLTLSCVDRDGYVVRSYSQEAGLEGVCTADGHPVSRVRFANGLCELNNVLSIRRQLYCFDSKINGGTTVVPIWAPFAVFPVVLVIVLAMMTRQILISLLAGIWMGALFMNEFNPIAAILRALDVHLIRAFGQTDHALILAFLIGVGGTIGIVTHNGGLAALVERLAGPIRTRRNALVATWLAGLGVFFDAYANGLTVGSTMRPLTDHVKISREKLAFLVDTTAASIATLALMSTWIGYELIQLDQAGGIAGSGKTGYEIILSSIPFGFYAILMLAFAFVLSWTQRDFGPMAKAERRAITQGQLFRPDSHPLVNSELTSMVPPDGRPIRAINAIVPLASLIAFVIAGLVLSGWMSPNLPQGASLAQIIGLSNSTSALLWAAGGASIVAIAVSIATRALTLPESMQAWIQGTRGMVLPCIVLSLAWAMGEVCQDLGTGQFLSSFLGSIDARFLPAMIFMTACLIGFSMGNTFATTAVMMSVGLPLMLKATADAPIDAGLVQQIRSASIGAILSGAIWGNHMSLVSDTTIVAATGAGCDHLDHVHTQWPYAAFVGLTALVVGFLPAGFGLSPLISYVGGLASILILAFIVCDKVKVHITTQVGTITAKVKTPTAP